MNHKKAFLCLVMVAMVATISVVFTTYSKDNDNKGEESFGFLSGKWYHIFKEDSVNIDPDFILEFKSDGTYSYNDPNRSINGYYKLFAHTDTTGIFTYLL